MTQPILINRSVKFLDAAIDEIEKMGQKYNSTISVHDMLIDSKIKDDVTRFLSNLGDTMYDFQLAKDDVLRRKRYEQCVSNLFFAFFMVFLVSSTIILLSLHKILPKEDMQYRQYNIVAICIVLYLFIIGTCIYIKKFVLIARGFNMSMFLQHKYVQKLTEMMSIEKFSFNSANRMTINTNNPILVLYTSLTKGWTTKMNIVINEEIPQSCDVIRSTTNELDFLTRCVPPSHGGHVYPFIGFDSVFPVNDIRSGVISFDQSLQSVNMYKSINYLKSIMLDLTSVTVDRPQLVQDIANVFTQYVSLVNDLALTHDGCVAITVDDATSCLNLCMSDDTCNAATYDTSSKACLLCKQKDHDIQFVYNPANLQNTMIKSSSSISRIQYSSGVDKLYIASSFSPSTCTLQDSGCLIGHNGAQTYKEKRPHSTQYCAISGKDLRYALYQHVISSDELVSKSISTNYQTMLSTYSVQFTAKVCQVYRAKDPFFDVHFNTALIDDVIEVVTASLGKTVNLVCVSLLKSILMACPVILLRPDATKMDKYISLSVFSKKIGSMNTKSFVNEFAHHIETIRTCSKGLYFLNTYYESSQLVHDLYTNIFKISMVFLPIIYAISIISAGLSWTCMFYMILLGVIIFEVMYTYHKKSSILFSINETLKDVNNRLIISASNSAVINTFGMVTSDHVVPQHTSVSQPSKTSVDHMFQSLETNCIVSEATTLKIPTNTVNLPNLYNNILDVLKAYDKCNDVTVDEPGHPPFPLLKFLCVFCLLVVSLIGFNYLNLILKPVQNIQYITKMNNLVKSLPSSLGTKGSLGTRPYTGPDSLQSQVPLRDRYHDVFAYRRGASIFSQAESLIAFTTSTVVVILLSVLIVRDADSFQAKIYNSTQYRDKEGCIRFNTM